MTILLVGETGLGKTTFVRNLFAAYARDASFPVNDASVPNAQKVGGLPVGRVLVAAGGPCSSHCCPCTALAPAVLAQSLATPASPGVLTPQPATPLRCPADFPGPSRVTVHRDRAAG